MPQASKGFPSKACHYLGYGISFAFHGRSLPEIWHFMVCHCLSLSIHVLALTFSTRVPTISNGEKCQMFLPSEDANVNEA